MLLPAVTVLLSAVLVTPRLGHWTVVDACFVIGAGMLPAFTVAVLRYVPQLASAVALVTWTETLAPAERSPRVQLSVCGEPPIEQLPWLGCEAIDQLTPEPPGSGSPSVTLLAVPVPVALEFETLIVKPIASPAFTVPVSAVFATVRLGHWTVIEACGDVAEPSLSAVAVAVLLYVPQLTAVVGDVM